jgi:hypothetical protein
MMEESVREGIERICNGLIVRLIHHYDHGEAEQAAALFVPDGVWVKSNIPYRGREAIVASFSVQPDRVMRHFTSNILVEVQDEERASVVTDYLAFVGRRADGNAEAPLDLPASLGEWRTSLVATADGWRIERHAGSRIFGRVVKP